jgi:hypothetical protein
MIVDVTRLVEIIREDGPREYFEDAEEYENDCLDVARLLLLLLSNGKLDEYMEAEVADIDGLEIKNQIKRACNVYGIAL